jgi:hypothetical protein
MCSVGVHLKDTWDINPSFSCVCQACTRVCRVLYCGLEAPIVHGKGPFPVIPRGTCPVASEDPPSPKRKSMPTQEVLQGPGEDS